MQKWEIIRILQLWKEDFSVSVKFNNWPFVGIVTSVGDKKYMIPLTSQTTEECKKEGKKKRSCNKCCLFCEFYHDCRNDGENIE